MKNNHGWTVTALKYNPKTDKTCIVCGKSRQYEIPEKWTPEMMIYALKKMRAKEQKNG